MTQNLLEDYKFRIFCEMGGIWDEMKLLIENQELLNTDFSRKNSLVQLIQKTEIDQKEYTKRVQEYEKNNLSAEILDTYTRLGIPQPEQDLILEKQGILSSSVALDLIIDSESVHTSFQKELQKFGIIFCPISEAVANYPELVKKYLGSVVSFTDNFYASLNSAVFGDGSFVYIPPNIRCPMELSSYFRINSSGTGQFERTLIIADKNSYVSYLEGCTAPQNSENQLHAAVVELIALDNAEIKYSTVQNWYAGNKGGVGGVFNFVTKRGICKGKNSKISWTQIETGSSITWKYPSVILKGDNSVGEFYSVAMTDNQQQADTGTRMIHIGKNTKSKIISKSVSLGNSSNTYRGKVQISKNAENSRNYTQCDNLFINLKKKITDGEIEKFIYRLNNCMIIRANYDRF
jgi:Fe-S cluster assembly protein SufB